MSFIRRVFGLPGHPATRVVGTHPVVDNKLVPFEVWLSPVIPEWSFAPVPADAPFRIVRKSLTTDAFLGYEQSVSLATLIVEFARSHLPRYGEYGMILDNRCRIIVGWLWDAGEDAFRWSGCQVGFELLATQRPVEAAIWEAAARQAVDYPLHNRVVMP